MSTLNTIRGQMVTSLHGRRLGLDKDEFLVTKGSRVGITAATSGTTATQIPNSGIVTLDSTTGDTWVLADPVTGCQVTIVSISTGGAQVINTNNATIMSSRSSTGDTLTLTGGTAAAILVGASTSLWVVAATHGTSVATHVSSA